MADNNYNIKPVENLQNVGSLSPIGRRKERKRKQNLSEQSREEQQQEQDKPTKENFDDEIAENDRDEHSIDYRA